MNNRWLKGGRKGRGLMVRERGLTQRSGTSKSSESSVMPRVDSSNTTCGKSGGAVATV